MPDSRRGPTVEVYPVTPGARASSSFRVRAGGRAVFAEEYAGISYARFAFRGIVTLEIDVEGALGDVRLLPQEAATREPAGDGTLRLRLAEPRSFVVWIGDREKLFVLADPIEAPPVPDDEAVVAVDPAVAADGTGLATAAIQAAIDRMAARRGGGTVVLPPGRFVTGTIRLASHVTLHLAAGALLEGSDDPADYPVDPGRSSSAGIRRWRGMPASTAGP